MNQFLSSRFKSLLVQSRRTAIIHFCWRIKLLCWWLESAFPIWNRRRLSILVLAKLAERERENTESANSFDGDEQCEPFASNAETRGVFTKHALYSKVSLVYPRRCGKLRWNRLAELLFESSDSTETGCLLDLQLKRSFFLYRVYTTGISPDKDAPSRLV